MKIRYLIPVLALGLAAGAVSQAANDTDHKIEKAARSSYNYRSVLDDRVKVSSEEGVVTLSGSVSDPDQKKLAEDTVEDLPGVVRVVNNIEVKPGPEKHSDEWIALKARGRLLVKANVSATDTDVKVRDGAVTLTGMAGSEAQKELTGMYVRDVDGVKSVDNQITVVKQPKSDRDMGEVIDDASITAQIKYALLTNHATSALRTSVDTREGQVVIGGEADSDAEKALVTHLAEGVRGVKDVHNEMTVAP